MKVALATCTTLPEPDADAPLIERALAAESIEAQWLAWDDPQVDWKAQKLVVIRSTWNYIHDYPAFLRFIDKIQGKSENHASVLRWNTHKRYLRDLDDAGFPTVDTVLVPKGSGVSLQAIMKKKKWFSAVVKPAIGAGSFLTKRVGGSQGDEVEFDASCAERDMLVQPYMAEVETHGERAIVYIDGEVTHAVRKSPRLDGADEKTERVEVADDERELATRLMKWTMRQFPCGALLYGRADLLRDQSGALKVMELELSEPSLFLNEETATRYARAIARRVT
jgi:hypothetical protein